MNLGPKADNLAILSRLFPNNVPRYIAIPFADLISDYLTVHVRAQAIADSFLTGAIDRKVLRRKSSVLRKSIVVSASITASLRSDCTQNQWDKISIRTSALAEDGDTSSFAGQYVSFLDSDHTTSILSKRSLDCFMSLLSERVLMYAKSKGMTTIPIGGSIVFQQMYFGSRSGVLFSEDGSGNFTFEYTDSWRNVIVEGDNSTSLSIPRIARNKTTYPKQFLRLIEFGHTLEREFGTPVDIEWSYNGTEIMLLQVRPQTTDTRRYHLNWDATNISENYPGITSPLTYTFIKNLYANVYPSFFRLMGLPESTLNDKSWVFDNALGYIDGKVYYRIDNWYELVKLIPGKSNEAFFEAMLNPAKRAGAKSHERRRSLPSLSVIVLSIRFVYLLLRSPLLSKRFSKKFNATYLETERLNWNHMSPQSSLDHLQSLRKELLVLWGIPILNDIRVMIFHGIFKTVIMKNADHELYLQCLGGFSDKASIRPLQALHALGIHIAQCLEVEDVASLDALRSTQSWKDITIKAEQFIQTYGGRTPDELQLENPRLGDSVTDVIELAFASKDADFSVRSDSSEPNLGLPIVKRLIARYVVHNMRSAISYRERFRFNRAQIFGVGRTVYLSIGHTFVDADILDDHTDIFWLSEQEVEAVIRGHSWEYDMRPIVRRRKSLAVRYKSLPLRMRVTGEGIIAPRLTTDTTPNVTGTIGLIGSGVAPGVVTAEAIVIYDFDPKLDVSGKILVVKHVDPGWTLLLVQAAGVISERGNPLSHVAIVSREIMIPAIVGIPDATSKIVTGGVITMNGTTGEVFHDT